jgi:hypothetical protein
MMSIGALLQYKDEFYGRFFAKKPLNPFSQNFTLMNTVHESSFSAFRNKQLGLPYDYGRKKYVLFPTQKELIAYPRAPSIKCSYLKCFISDPYIENETIDGWVQEAWLEPLNNFSTYFEEFREEIKEIIKRKAEEPSKNVAVLSPIEVYRSLQKRSSAKKIGFL